MKRIDPELLTRIKGLHCYDEENDIIVAVNSEEDLTAETFKVLMVINGEVKLLTADDFGWYDPINNDFDFVYFVDKSGNKESIGSSDVSDKIRDFLNGVIEKRADTKNIEEDSE